MWISVDAESYGQGYDDGPPLLAWSFMSENEANTFHHALDDISFQPVDKPMEEIFRLYEVYDRFTWRGLSVRTMRLKGR